MCRQLFLFVNLLLSLILISAPVRCFMPEVDEMSKRLDGFLNGIVRSKNSIEDSVNNEEFWQTYEFGSGVGNREELSITNITTIIDSQLLMDIDNYQSIEKNDEYFLAGTSENVFHFWKIDVEKSRTIYRIDVNSWRNIENFKIFEVPNSSRDKSIIVSTLFVIMCVRAEHGTDMLWYKLNEDKFVYYDSWPVQNRVECLQFFHHEGQNRLLILREETLYMNRIFSPIDIYGFSIDGERPNFWVTQRLNVAKTFDIEICPSYESTIIALRRKNDVVIYEYVDGEKDQGLFHEHQNVTSNNLRNVVCFESGYVRYLVTSGPEAAVFDFYESEFQHDSYTEHIFNEIGEISWIQSLRVDNYREESILLAQLKNHSTIALSWKGRGFRRISLPNLELENIDLSRATILPKFGLVSGNKLVKITSMLVEKSRPVRHEMEKLLPTRYALEEVVKKQKLIIDETEARMNKSYFANPRITGFWNLSSIEAKSLRIEAGLFPEELAIGGKKMSLKDFLSDENEARDSLIDLEARIDEIRVNLENSISIDTPEVNLTGDLFIDGNFEIRGTLHVDRLKFDYFNGISREEIIEDYSNHDENLIIEGVKTFESIEAENLVVSFVNDESIDEIKFSTLKNDYSSVDFSKVTKLKVEGNLNFTTINHENWQQLMNKVVLKSRTTTIPGITVVDGDLVADNIEIELFNGLSYPEDYIMSMNRDPVVMTGKKKFDKLTVVSIVSNSVDTINGAKIDEYVTLNGDNTLQEEATFEDLTVTENFRIDGKVSGLSGEHESVRRTLNETSNVSSDTIFKNLKIIGDFQVENSLNGTSWSELDDLVSVDDEEASITGEKYFSKSVRVDGKLAIDKESINGRSIDEFLTLDTDQVLPNLEKISGNVKFADVKRDDFESMKKLLTKKNEENFGDPTCLAKVIVFKVAPRVEGLFFKTVNKNVSSLAFMAAANRTFGNVVFQNLQLTNLRGGEILPIFVNDENFSKFDRSRISRTIFGAITGNYEIRVLETNFLNVRTINGLTPRQFENLRISLDDFYRGITDGSARIERLTVNGSVRASKVNGDDLKDSYDPEAMGKVHFSGDAYVERLVVDGLVNAVDFDRFVEDSVTKIDRNVVVKGDKIFGRIVCESLKASSVNGKSVRRILDPDRHQVISGKLAVNGTIKVENRFETDGKIGKISWRRISERFSYLENDTYSLTGDVKFTGDGVKIEKLIVSEKLRGVDFDDFVESAVRKNNDNITIYGPVIFRDSVTIDSPLTITETYNDLDLKHFYEHAVRVDRPLRVKSKVMFTKDIRVENDLTVDVELKTATIGKIDLKELYENAAYVDRPMFIPGSVMINDVIFESNIEVENLNDIDLGTVVTLDGEQTFDRTLGCQNITIARLEIGGDVNNVDYDSLYNDTFMLAGNQDIWNQIVFDGIVHCRNRFDATLINGIDPSKVVNLDGNDTLIGNFVFKRPLVVHGALHTKGPINDIDLVKWEASVVTRSFPIRQIVKGAWKIHGNVHFEKNVHGNDFLNGVNVTEFFQKLHIRDTEVDLTLEDAKKDLRSFCQDIKILKTAAENQVYKYEFFDYLQVLNFDRKIVSVHHFEWENFDYLLVNFFTGRLDIFVFTGEEFSTVASLSNVGHVENWLTFGRQEEVYFLTVGKEGCGKNPGNLWKLRNDQFIHVEDLGNVTDAKKINEDEFLILVDGAMIRRSIDKDDRRFISSDPIDQEDLSFVTDSSEVLLANNKAIYEYKFTNGTEKRRIKNCFGTKKILSVRYGIYEREAFVYHAENVSEEYLFITDKHLGHHKILQTIEVQRPSSIFILNFDGLIENFLIFMENHRALQIYEYRGIEGFVHRESIRIPAEKVITFKLRKYSKLAKKHCIAAIQDKKLVLLEAKIHGERLDMGKLRCD